MTLTRLRADERGLALRTLVLVAMIRIALWFVPVKKIQRLTGNWKKFPLAVSPDMPVPRLVWAVIAASRRVPGATCLTQSLALHCLLTRAGHHSQLRIGVMKNHEDHFRAHAWVEYNGQPLLSSSDELQSYVQVSTMEDQLA